MNATGPALIVIANLIFHECLLLTILNSSCVIFLAIICFTFYKLGFVYLSLFRL